MLGIDKKAARYTWSAAVVLLLLLCIYLIRDTIFIFVIALLLAYLLYPLMDMIDRRLSSRTRMPALALTYLLVIGLVGAFGAVVGSAVADQAENLSKTAPAFLEHIRQQPVQSQSKQPVKTVKEQAAAAIELQIRQHYNDIVSFVPRFSLRLLSASSNLIYVVIVPILTFFILLDGRTIRDNILEMVGGARETADETLNDIHTLLLQYMRALLFLCLATFVTFSIALSVLGVPYALLLASIAFPLEFIPLVGPLGAAAMIVAVSAFSGYQHVLWVVIFLGIYRMFQDYVLSPHLMSKGVELHPLLVIFGVFAGGEIGGVPGIFLSVPTLALARLLYHRLRKSRVTVASSQLIS